MITIDEAIKSNQVVYVDLRSKDKIALAKGVQLGIEALKFRKALEDSPYGPRYELLPGETEE